jgi:hypothetical protein
MEPASSNKSMVAVSQDTELKRKVFYKIERKGIPFF